MNTRLQVEHPVTEMVTGLDLVRAQILVAAGEPLPWSAGRPGAARARAWSAASTPRTRSTASCRRSGGCCATASRRGRACAWTRGVAEGDEITVHYDPMIAKLVGPRARTAPRRSRACCAALRDYVVLGIATNAAYLDAVLAHPAFAAGDTHTGFLLQHLPGEAASGDAADETAALVAAALNEAVRGAAADVAPRAATAAPAIGRFRLKGLD